MPVPTRARLPLLITALALLAPTSFNAPLVAQTISVDTLIYDLKSLRNNKNVPDTIRKVAAKLYTEKASRGGAKKE